MCKNNDKFVVSCSILEGFECCKCCGITECRYDICPPEEKIINKKSMTVYEYNMLCEIRWIFNRINNSKNAFIEKRFSKSYCNDAKFSYEKFKKLKKDIENDEKIRPHLKKILIRRIRNGINCCEDLNRYMLEKVRKKKKHTTYDYFKKHINKFSIKSIRQNEILCDCEKRKLIKIKIV